MPFWINIFFIDANSPTIEQIIFFHDHSIIIIISIIVFLIIIFINIIINKTLFLNLTENQSIETLWTILPIFLLIFIAIPRLRLLYLIEERFNPNLTLKIIGHQWYWSYEYPNFNINFDSFISTSNNINKFRLLENDNSIFLPFNIQSRLLFTSIDVIHSWTIQSLGIKIDAIPGRLNQFFFQSSRPGLFFGQCSEICGINHRFMPITIKITSINNFIKWISSKYFE